MFRYPAACTERCYSAEILRIFERVSVKELEQFTVEYRTYDEESYSRSYPSYVDVLQGALECEDTDPHECISCENFESGTGIEYDILEGTGSYSSCQHD